MATILVVDDERTIVETVVELLTWDGHVLVSASNGVRALEALAKRRPDLVLMDFMMPLKDGIETLRIIRNDPQLASLPVILMTAAPMSIPADAPRYDQLLVKPFNVQGLREAIERVLGPTPMR
ncbi:MAG: response regulator [Labilithrix sp.]|nr:response regulator [Labilithrix sp.]